MASSIQSSKLTPPQLQNGEAVGRLLHLPERGWPRGLGVFKLQEAFEDNLCFNSYSQIRIGI